mmetsp:Transcript_25200/g.33747  ORF Transcript_25200/g.33747 Transcript_25200/m.33747 type:complete len:128 (+) Transcript_25200:962-1345(+)|eukprot:CAMPEP_0185599134 /NCGR_PEP_ID=MMETSP0434-20130131/82488_1 /TAXON_ID=626734 ORGANISM="Favella taraikaensis, Strain Fe Narragansett Bay" /NCGR_SAMPLE_ID=MMETSP0434 /ASSEMBLY_ACC=CAM_ASM_000379 /LENGTH=127 /DNA_ID=CAMNT_0028228403 /DNA_START=988 /DNA_END=1368 /DNA_ORIENTATION=-
MPKQLSVVPRSILIPPKRSEERKNFLVMGQGAPIMRRTHAELNKSQVVGLQGAYLPSTSVDLGGVVNRKGKLSDRQQSQSKELDVSTDRRGGGDEESMQSPLMPFTQRQIKMLQASDKMMTLMNWQG